MSVKDSISCAMDRLLKSYIFIFPCIWIGYHIFKSIYNVFFHPLRNIPGPKLAAATYIPEFYHDVVKFGRYTNRIKEMHEQYGTTPNQISPNVLYVLDHAKI